MVDAPHDNEQRARELRALRGSRFFMFCNCLTNLFEIKRRSSFQVE